MTRKAKPPRLPQRPRDGHKGTFGRVLVVAGSRDMPGAAVLCSLGALRGGAGLVTLAAPRGAIDRMAAAAPCATFVSLPESSSGCLTAAAEKPLLARARMADAVVIGPGLGGESASLRLVRRLVSTIERPLLIDADGLNALAGQVSKGIADRKAPTILTPHAGEFVRLDGGSLPSTAAERRSRAEELARELHAVVCLKGSGTVVTDGASTYVNDTGNPGMATGGSGDVLSGLMGALLARWREPLPAAICAVRLHGLAGDLAAAAASQEALIATDLLDQMGAAFLAYRQPTPKRARSTGR